MGMQGASGKAPGKRLFNKMSERILKSSPNPTVPGQELSVGAVHENGSGFDHHLDATNKSSKILIDQSHGSFVQIVSIYLQCARLSA